MSEGHRFVTRSKTGSLVPKQFTDSVLPTVSLKTALKASLAELEAGDPGRMTRSRTAVNASFVVTSLPGFFRLGKCCLLFDCVFLEFLHVACVLISRDVKRSLEIRTSNKTCEFGFVFQPFDIRLLTAFCGMLLFVFDHDCVDHSVRICSQAVLLWCPLP